MTLGFSKFEIPWGHFGSQLLIAVLDESPILPGQAWYGDEHPEDPRRQLETLNAQRLLR